MRLWKKTASFFLAVVLMVGMLPVGASAAGTWYAISSTTGTKAEVSARLEEIRAQMDGRYFNGNDYKAGRTEAQCIADIKSANYVASTSTSNCPNERSASDYSHDCTYQNKFSGAAQCNGFAQYMVYAIYGEKRDFSKPQWTQYYGGSPSKVNELVPGDVINLDGGAHWEMVWYVSGDTLYIADCNYGAGKTANCKIAFRKNPESVSTVLSKVNAGTYRISRTKCAEGWISSGTTSDPTNIVVPTEAEYLKKCTVTTFNAICYPKNSSIAVRTIPTDCKVNGVAYTPRTSASGRMTVTKKVVNEFGNVWYKLSTGVKKDDNTICSYIYGNDVYMLSIPTMTVSDETTTSAMLKGTIINPNKTTLAYGGYIIGTSSLSGVNATTKTALEAGKGYTVVAVACDAGWEQKEEIPCAYRATGLKSGTTYYVRMVGIDSANNVYLGEEIHFTTVPVLVTNITLNKTSASICVGQSFSITPTITPTNASNKTVNWTSSNTAVATVSAGTVTGKAAGTATITAAAVDNSGKKASCTVTVKNHSNTYVVSVKPTTSAAGKLTGTCSVCGGTTTITLPKLDTTNYTYAVTKAATCSATGTGRYTWKTTTYGTFYFDVSVAKSAHKLTYAVTTKPTTSATGKLTGTCSVCAGTTAVTLPKLDTTEYSYAVTKAATCAATGTGRYTWKTTTYGSWSFDTTIEKTSHKFGNYSVSTKPTVSTSGKLTGSCSVCSATDSITLPMLNETNYSYNVVAESTSTEAGTARYTWKNTTYGNFYFDVKLPKLNAALTGIQVIGYPRKSEYELGEDLDTTGMCLMLLYDDGSIGIATADYSVDGFDPDVAGEQILTVRYKGFETTFDVRVIRTEFAIHYMLGKGQNSQANPHGYARDTETFSLKNPTLKGYIFRGWYKESSYETKVTQIEKGSSGDITLYAKWERVTYKITYKLNKGKNNAKNIKTFTVDTPTFTLRKPTRRGYKFVGWYLDARFKKKITRIPTGTVGNLKLYAKWKRR